MADTRYNGWTNYETWNVALWIGNEEGSYRYWQDRTEAAYRDAVDRFPSEDREHWSMEAVNTLSEELENEHEENMPKLSGTYGDMLTAALGEVNWYEIATNYIEDLDRDEIEKEVIAASQA